jgi:hypothetical protein
MRGQFSEPKRVAKEPAKDWNLRSISAALTAQVIVFAPEIKKFLIAFAHSLRFLVDRYDKNLI